MEAERRRPLTLLTISNIGKRNKNGRLFTANLILNMRAEH